MHKQLQQFKESFLEHGLAWLVAAYLFFLPLYIGEIVFSEHALILGQYVNYLHVRITMHLLINTALVVWYFFHQSAEIRKKITICSFLGLASLALLWAYPISQTASTAEANFWPLLLSSLFHFVKFVLAVFAAIIVTKTVLSTTVKNHLSLFRIAIFSSIIVQTIFAVAQYLLKGPWLPDFFSWIGQPMMFTSDSVIDMFVYPRIYGTTPHPNILAAIMCYFVILLFSLWQKQKAWQTVVAFLAASLLVVASLSKIGIVCLIAIITVYVFRNRLETMTVSRCWKYALLAVFTFLPILGVILVSKTFPGLSYLESRGQILRTYHELVAQNPYLLLTGAGFTFSIPTLLANSDKLAALPFTGNSVTVEPLHNSLLLLVFEFGLPIFLVAMWFIKKQYHRLSVLVGNVALWQRAAFITLLFLFGGFDHLLVY